MKILMFHVRCSRQILLVMVLGLFTSVAVFAQRLNERTISINRDQTQIVLWEEAGPRGELDTYYQIDRNGISHTRQANYLLKLRHGDFDPLQDSVGPRSAILTSGADQNVYIVQFVTQPLEEYRQAIAKEGGQVRFFMANNAHLVHMTPATRNKVANLPFVRWIGAYHPAYRLEEMMLENENNGLVTPTLKYNIMLFESEKNVKSAVADRIQKIGGKVDRDHAGKYLMEATLTHDQLIQLVGWDEVLFVDRWTPVEADMDLARQIGGADFLETMEGLTGEGVRGEIIDLGFNMTHVDFDHHPLIAHTAVNSDSHGAACSGIVFGDGTGNPAARGLMPMGQGIVADWDEVSVGMPRYDHTGELIADPYFAVFQTASVGSGRTTQYTTISADTDAALFDFDIVHCQSQSNAGDQMSRPQAWAKNIISGGGIQHQNTLDRSDDCWCNGASIGPATDGRIKPDLSHFYDGILTTTTGSTTSYTSSFGGTSGATPIIAGYAGLVFEIWHKGILGNNPDINATVFENRCHMTTAKALLINTAFRYDFTGQAHDLTRVHQGWGMPDLEALYNLRDKIIIVDEEDVLPNMATANYTANVLAGEPELKVTMVFADPPGVPSASQHRINDLNLKVTSPSGTVYWGNNGLLEGNVSIAGGSPNEVDTVENVFILNPEAGAWSVEVIANEVNQDSHVETAAVDADFALVITGAVRGPAFGIAPTPSSLSICAPANGVVNLDIGQVLGFSESITLSAADVPAGATATFSSNPVTAPANVMLTLSNLGAVTPGDYTISVTGTSASLTKVVFVNVNISNAAPMSPGNPVPANGSADAGLMPTLSWDASDQTQEYTLEIADSEAFTNIVYTTMTRDLSHDVDMRLDPLTCYFWRVRGSNGCGDGEWTTSAFTTLDQPDYLTQLFQSGFDLANMTLSFIPDGTGNYYRSCIDAATALPTDPAGGTAITLTDDSSAPITPAQAVNFYGTTYSTIFVGSNGFVTFTAGDSARAESLVAHFNQPRVAALFDDLNPAAAGTVTYRDMADRLAITFEGVPEYNVSNSNTFQIEFFHNGEIHITWLGIASDDNLVGLSRGGGVPPDFLANDFSASSSCSVQPIARGMGCMASDCREDLNNDDIVDETDLLLCAGSWHGASGTGDLNRDGVVNIMDMTALMSAYGSCSPTN